MKSTLDDFITSCVSAIEEADPKDRISDLVRDLLSEPQALSDCLGSPVNAMLQKLYVSNKLTILNVVWAPKMTLMPHDHNTWAVIGVYAGREDNILWRRIKGDPHGRIEAAGARSIPAGEVVSFGRDVVHSVTNPTAGFTGAIHVYGGNFFELPRSEWDPVSLDECSYNVENALALFEAENQVAALRQQINTGRLS